MTVRDLCNEAWEEMPRLRRRLAGRAFVDDMVKLCVINWEGDYLDACADDVQRKVYASAMLQQTKRAYQPISGYEPGEYGFVWVFLLSAAASALIQWLIKRWLDRRFGREEVAAWKQELLGAAT